MSNFPLEIIEEILQNTRPAIISAEDDRLAGGLSGFGIMNNWWTQPKLYQTSWQPQYEAKYYHRYKALLPLRLVNRIFNKICTSHVFQEINLLNHCDGLTEEITRLYGGHVRVLRISMDKYGLLSTSNQKDAERVLTMIGLCPGIRTLILYYGHGNLYAMFSDEYLTKVIKPFLLSSQYRNLDAIGIYYSPSRSGGGVAPQIRAQVDQLANSGRSQLLKRLDISLPSWSRDQLEAIRTKFRCLEHLTIHGNFSGHFGTLDPSSISLTNWSQYAQLTTLRLIGYTPQGAVWSMRLSDIVRASHSISYLYISDMETFVRDAPPLRSPGWSDHGDDWWNRRKPLAELQITASVPEVVYYLGTIPASSVKLTLLSFRIKGDFWIHDEELFPQMQKMTCITNCGPENPDVRVYVQVMYNKRGVLVEMGAPRGSGEV
ncbi:hypothetical protein CPB86DRAFT_778951 [Serendipita vermifera]|nr:hypothetical protein CPB86DRAFT_778951 [Serendipita vermifera]